VKRWIILLPVGWFAITTLVFLVVLVSGRLLEGENPLVLALILALVVLVLWPYGFIRPALLLLGPETWDTLWLRAPNYVYWGIPIMVQLALYVVIGWCIDRKREKAARK
jgi:amino acid permease